MTLEQNIMEQLKAAMRSKNEAELRTLRAIKAAILIEKTSGGNKDTLSENEEIKLVQKLAKQRKDSLDIYLKQNRADLAEKEKEEIEILERFLPQQMSVEDIVSELKKIITQVGASSPADMGKVMGVATKALAGKADGKVISEQVKTLLNP